MPGNAPQIKALVGEWADSVRDSQKKTGELANLWLGYGIGQEGKAAGEDQRGARGKAFADAFGWPSSAWTSRRPRP